MRLDSPTNKPTKLLNTLGIFVASNPHQPELQINQGHKAESALPLTSFCAPHTQFCGTGLMSASLLAKITFKVKFGGGGLNSMPYYPLVRIKPGSSAFRYQQANDPAAAASGWLIAQMRPK